MGNQLTGIAPPQILPVEHYLTDVTDLIFDTSLGSTRFLKVVRAKSSEGHVVVKLFTIPDQSIDLIKERDRLLEIKRMLEGCINCMPFMRTVVSERAGFMIRQYVKQSLYDRLSTRPFLTLIEKKWIAFQLLLATQQAHKHGVCHGDMKLENVMITSWNWVLLTDFATFKPTYLPEDNPAEFSYFFDTSRKRKCYIAPERFHSRRFPFPSSPAAAAAVSDSSLHSDHSNSSTNLLQAVSSSSQFLPDGDAGDRDNGEMLPSMDIFSAGCSLIELFTDTAPFTLSTLLAYRAEEYFPEKTINKIEDQDIKDLVRHMIQRDPSSRLTANEYLQDQKGKAFPDYFYTFLQSYMQIFSTDTHMTPDQKIAKIEDNIESLLGLVTKDPPSFDRDGLSLIVALVTANVRSIKFCSSKLGALKVLGQLAEQVSSETILDRILPFVMLHLSDNFASVRVSAIECLVKCLANVSSLPRSDMNVFPDYILPHVHPMCHDKSERVRMAMARNIAKISKLSVSFLDLALVTASQSGDGGPEPTYEVELSSLIETVGQMVQVLMADQVNAVKQVLMEESVTELAVFFGKTKANDILLSHMITFLNDKDDAHLRNSFYNNIIGVASYVGSQSSDMLLPLLQQGLWDPEEFVIVSCVNAMSTLVSMGLLQRPAIYDLLKETCPYLLHPNLWIRQATVGLICTSVSVLPEVDVWVKAATIVRPYLKTEVINLKSPALLLSALELCLPRRIYDAVVKGERTADIFYVLEERQTKRSKVAKSMEAGKGEGAAGTMHTEVMDGNLRQLLRRLASEGMSTHVEEQLLHLKESLIRISQNIHMTKDKKKSSRGEDEGWIELKENGGIEIRQEALIRTSRRGHSPSPSSPPSSTSQTANTNNPGASSSSTSSSLMANSGNNNVTMNEEWQHMFGGENQRSEEETLPQVEQQESREKEAKAGAGDQGYYAACKTSLDHLVLHKRGEHDLSRRKRHQISQGSALEAKNPPEGYRPKGQLRAHMHEHDGAIVKVARVPDNCVFASAARDGCVRLWDIQKMEGSNLVNRAHRIYNNHDGSPLTGLALSMDNPGYNQHLMATAAEDGSVVVKSLETNNTVYSTRLDVHTQGPAGDLFFLETGSTPLVTYGCAYGDVVAVDLRKKGIAYKLENGPESGIQTALSISDDQAWCVCGTSNGTLVCWDLRFKLPISRCKHPSEAASRIRQVQVQPGETTANVLVAVQGHNEVGIWNMESQSREFALWGSNAPPLSTSKSPHFVTVLHGVFGPRQSFVLTAGTDMRLRYWDLRDERESFVVAGAGSEKINQNHFKYSKKLVDGIDIQIETSREQPPLPAAGRGGLSSESNAAPNGRASSGQSTPAAMSMAAAGGLAAYADQLANKPGLDPPAMGHHDWISGLCLCPGSTNNWYIVTGSKDGVIKVWS